MTIRTDPTDVGTTRRWQADWTYLNGRLHSGVTVTVRDGLITAVEGAAEPETGDRIQTERLSGALFPGLVSAHSHAFQRRLRGRAETFPRGAGTFWSWRDAMYALADELTPDALLEVCTATYREMLAAGITSVGEFHYLHHWQPDEQDFAFDAVILEAASVAGIRLTLLEAYYETGDIGTRLAGAQARFATPSPEVFWRQCDALGGQLGANQSLGLALHSIRAVPPEHMAELHAEARRRGMVVHMHLEEQRREIASSIEAYGASPAAVVLDRLDPGPEFTAVHATHTRESDLRALADAGSRVCVCPLTEGNLADGLPNLDLAWPDLAVCLGTDSNVRISLLEEMRWLEYGQRVRSEERGRLVDSAGALAPALIEAATVGGADALGLRTGAIRPGLAADFVLVDPEVPPLAGVPAADLPAAWVTGGDERTVAGVCVAGRWQMGDGLHRL